MKTYYGKHRKKWFCGVLTLLLTAGMLTQHVTSLPVKAADEGQTREEVSAGNGYAVTYTGEEYAGYKKTGTYPAKSGYVFAGWYDNNTTLTVGTALKAVPEEGKGAYAYFVDEKVLRAGWQINYGENQGGAGLETTDLRLITTVDSLRYQNVGFEVYYDGKKLGGDKISSTVYKQIAAWTEDGVQDKKPTEFSEVSCFFMTYRIDGIPKTAFADKFEVTPFWTTLDGTRVEGRKNVFNINEDGDMPVMKPENLERISFADFGFGNVAIGENFGSTQSKAVLNTSFRDTITFHKAGAVDGDYFICYGAAGGWDGLRIEPSADGTKLTLSSPYENEIHYELLVENVQNLTSFRDVELKLRIDLWEIGGGNAYMDVYINGGKYNEKPYVLKQAVASGLLGSSIIFISTQGLSPEPGNPSIVIGERENLEDLTAFTISDLTLTDGAGIDADGKVGGNGANVSYQVKGLSSLDGTVFKTRTALSGEKNVAPGYFRVGEKTSGSSWDGLLMYREPSNIDFLQFESKFSGHGKYLFALHCSEAGLTSWGEKFDFYLSFKVVDSDQDGAEDDLRIGLYFNGKFNRFIYLEDTAEAMGTYIGYNANQLITVKSIQE